MDIARAIEAAHRRIAGCVRRTPVVASRWLGDLSGCRVHLKLENQQETGSFKLRGAMNKLLCLTPAERARGVVAASTGNHGSAMAFGAAALGCPAVIFAPTTARAGKLAAIRAMGAEVRHAGEDCLEAESAARAFAIGQDATYVSPYNDPDVVAGQGTVGLELREQLGRIDAVVVAVGGGGLIGGIGGYLEVAAPEARILGASPRNSAVMRESLAAGRIVDAPSLPTLSDGTAGGIEPGSITFPLCQRVVDDFVLVSEAEIAAAIRGTVEHHHMLIEGAAAVAVAAVASGRTGITGGDIAVVVCGANIDAETLRSVL